MNMSAEYWIWLSLVLGTSCDKIGSVLELYGDAKSFYEADDKTKIEACSLSPAQAKRLHTIPRRQIHNIINDCESSGVRIVSIRDYEYPDKLFSIPDPPVVLYIKGKPLSVDGRLSIAVVGPRKISSYGADVAHVISGTLASCGAVIVSGGAIGGDSAAHNGAMQSGGYTVGVLGAGVNSGYLKQNEELRERIVQNGCLVSEYPPSQPATRGSFPRRNRIMSGLCDGVVVVEGGIKSGTLITARHAAEQGRDVFVIPGSPSVPQYEGSNRLIVDGARPLLSVCDIINEYAYTYKDTLHVLESDPGLQSDHGSNNEVNPDNNTKKPKAETEGVEPEPKAALKPPTDLSILSQRAAELYKTVADRLPDGEFSADDAAELTGSDISEIFSDVTELEIAGLAKAGFGGRYKIVK